MRLNSEMRMLLDKLYNLRGEDSVVLVSMDKERDQAIKTKERTSKRTTELTSQIEKLESEGHILAKEGESFKSALETIRKDDFINVLKELDIAFDPEEIKKELEVKLPKTLEEFSMEKEKAEKELVTVEDEMNSATTKIEELGLRKDEALANQERLNRYFDLALEGNINITRDEITSLLEKFNFSEEEQREAAKLLMFPEDGLYEYEKSLKGIKSKSISDVFKEAKEEWLASFEGEYIRTLLERNGYNISQASRESEIDRKYFRKLMKKYGISADGADASDVDDD